MNSADHAAWLRARAGEWGLELSGEVAEGLVAYAGVLCGYDEANVVGSRDLDVLVRDHVLDSLSCLLVPEVSGARRLVDVGSGGGLPGAPLAIALPTTEVTLLEATGKKARFLRHAAGSLGLENVVVVNERAEDFGLGAGRERFDVATSRAVASLAVLAEYSLPLLCVGGISVAMKARLSEEEGEGGAVAARRLAGRVRETRAVPAWGGADRARNLVVYEKVGGTPAGYPRRAGTPRKRPLGGG